MPPYRQLKKLCCVGLAIGLFWHTSNVFSADKFSISADKILYDSNNVNLYASGNVDLKYKSYEIQASDFRYIKNKDQKELQFLEDVQLKKDGFTINAESATYDLNNLTGKAQLIRANLGKLMLNGHNANLLKDHIEMTQASFTTCSLEHPHYLIKADSLQIYPQMGLFISYNNFLYLDDTLVFYFPSYIYVAKGSGGLSSNSPLPEFGRKDAEGWFFKGKASYFLNPSFTGFFNYGYAENWGYLLGIAQNMRLSKYQNVEVKLDHYSQYGFQGGLLYDFDVTGYIAQSAAKIDGTLLDQLFSQFNLDKNLPVSDFSALYAYHQLENNYYMNFLPLVRLRLSNFTLPIKNLKLDTSFTAGRIGEYQGSYQKNQPIYYATRYNINAEINKSITLNAYEFKNKIGYQGFWYSDNNCWQRVFDKLEVDYNFSWFTYLKPGINYVKIFVNRGASPFGFDAYEVELVDEVGYKLQADVGLSTILLENQYFVHNLTQKSLDITNKLNFHCWQLNLKYRFVQKEWSFSVELL